MQITPHFSLAELTVTSTNIPNIVEPEHLPALHITAYGMEIVRHVLGDVPIHVTSGYRNRKVNAAVGGVSNSDHALGYACDFRHSSMTAFKAACKIIESPIVFDQLILERNNTIIHLSFNPRYRREVLRQPGGPGTVFYKGLE